MKKTVQSPGKTIDEERQQKSDALRGVLAEAGMPQDHFMAGDITLDAVTIDAGDYLLMLRVLQHARAVVDGDGEFPLRDMIQLLDERVKARAACATPAVL